MDSSLAPHAHGDAPLSPPSHAPGDVEVDDEGAAAARDVLTDDYHSGHHGHEAHEQHGELQQQQHHDEYAGADVDMNALHEAHAQAQHDEQQQQQHDTQRLTDEAAHELVTEVMLARLAESNAQAQQQQQHMQAHDDAGESSTSAPPPPAPRQKRARTSTAKITRHRPITSCLQCRARKAKCDRARPRCGGCPPESPCTYVDADMPTEAVVSSIANIRKAEEEDEARRAEAKRARLRGSTSHVPDHNNSNVYDVSVSTSSARHALIERTYALGKRKDLDFDVRVRASRAAGVGAILFSCMPTARMSSSHGFVLPGDLQPLQLPQADDVGPLLDAYRAHVEPLCNAVVIDLNRPRIRAFLRWWHSDPDSLPADPPLVPLVLVVLALSVQALRTAGKGGEPEHDRFHGCDVEKRLLETAGRCIDNLQIACPSNWSSAFSAPLDLVRASMLRGLWHLGELHLQFATSAFAATLRLAHAAGLHRDPKHWKGMGKEEAQARRNMWYSCLMLEVTHAHRLNIPCSITGESFDSELPNDHSALLGLFTRASELQAAQAAATGVAAPSSRELLPPSRMSFEFHLARYSLARLFAQRGAHPSRTDLVSEGGAARIADVLAEWRAALPAPFEGVLQLDEGPLTGAGTLDDEDDPYVLGNGASTRMTPEDIRERKRIAYFQRVMLRMLHLQTRMAIYRPQFDVSGAWRPPGDAQRALRECLDSAQRIVHLVSSLFTSSPPPPFQMYHAASHQLFQAAVILSVQSALCSPSDASGAHFRSLARPIIDRAVETFDVLSGNTPLRNVCEQAARYASTLREMDAVQLARQATAAAGGAEAKTGEEESNATAASASNSMQRATLGILNAQPAAAESSSSGAELASYTAPASPPATSPLGGATSAAPGGMALTEAVPTSWAESSGSGGASAQQTAQSALEAALFDDAWWQSIDGSYSQRSFFPSGPSPGPRAVDAALAYYAGNGGGAHGADGSGGGAGGAHENGPYGGPNLPPTGLDLLASQVDHAPRASDGGAPPGGSWQQQQHQQGARRGNAPRAPPSTLDPALQQAPWESGGSGGAQRTSWETDAQQQQQQPQPQPPLLPPPSGLGGSNGNNGAGAGGAGAENGGRNIAEGLPASAPSVASFEGWQAAWKAWESFTDHVLQSES